MTELDTASTHRIRRRRWRTTREEGLGPVLSTVRRVDIHAAAAAAAAAASRYEEPLRPDTLSFPIPLSSLSLSRSLAYFKANLINPIFVTTPSPSCRHHRSLSPRHIAPHCCCSGGELLEEGSLLLRPSASIAFASPAAAAHHDLPSTSTGGGAANERRRLCSGLV